MKHIKFRYFFAGKFFYWGFIERNGLNFIPPTWKQKHKSLTRDDVQRMSRQFTNAHDRTGIAIYEGAIIREHPNGYIGLVTKGEDGNFYVEWEDKGYPDWNWNEFFYDHLERIEVLGDIDRTPELWKFKSRD